MKYVELLSRTCSGGDIARLLAGFISALLFGASIPVLCLRVGDLVDIVGGETGSEGTEILKERSFGMIFIGFFVWVVSFL